MADIGPFLAVPAGDMNRWDVPLKAALVAVNNEVVAINAEAGPGGFAPGTAVYLPAPNAGVDQTAAIQAVIDSAAALGARSVVGGGRYLVNGQLTIAAPVTLSGNFELYSTGGTAVQTMIYVTSSDVHLRDFTIVGPQFAAGADQTGVNFYSATGVTPLARVSAEGLTVRNFGKNGILGNNIVDFRIDNNDVRDCCYSGIGVLSGVRGTIDGNRVRNITQTGYVNSYGIYATHIGTVDDLVTYPLCADVSIQGNVISAIPLWDGINTHGGRRHTICGNVIVGCKKPMELVSLGPLIGGVKVEKYAPTDILVCNNTIWSGVTDGSMGAGIAIVGAEPSGGGVGGATEYATGVISGNIIRGHGTHTSALSGGIVAYYTQGLVITDNLITEPSPYGVVLYHDNLDATVRGNTCVDPWSNSLVSTGLIAVNSGGYNTARVTENTLVRGTKTATNIVTRGAAVSDHANNVIGMGVNNFAASPTPVSDPGRRTQTWLKTGSSTTALRPSAVTAGAGSVFFDTTLSKPIWSDGTVWRDSAGTAV